MMTTLSKHAGRTEIAALLRELHDVTSESPARWGDLDLTLTQLRTLFVLQARGALRVSDLARALGMSLASASALADRLVRLDMLVRHEDPVDRRSVRLALAPNGTRVIERLERRSRARLLAAIRGMTAAERDAFVVVLRALLRGTPRRREER